MDKLYQLCLILAEARKNWFACSTIAEYLWKEGYKATEWELILQFVFDGPDYVEQAVKEWGIRQ